MNTKAPKFPPVLVLVAILVTAAIVTPVALASAADGKPASRNALVQRVARLAKRVVALEARTTPGSLPPSGPAGGALTGSYPAPGLAADSVGPAQIAPDAVGAAKIAADAVGTSEIAADAVGAAEIAPHAVGTDELAPASVGSNELGTTVFAQGQGVAVAAGSSAEATVTCPAGHPRLLSGGPEWEGDSNGTAVIYSVPSPTSPGTTWVVRGRVDIGGTANTIFADALCI
jgi:hypothetical protein